MSERRSASVRKHVARLLAHVGEATDLKSWLRLHRKKIGCCPFLDDDGSCGVYAIRPISCRSLLSTKNGEWCGVDFGDLSLLEKQLYMNSLDRETVAFPVHYVAAALELGRQREDHAVRRMAECFGFSLTGNLPFLVFLEREHRLSKAAAQGEEAAAGLLEKEGLNHPFLVVLDR